MKIHYVPRDLKEGTHVVTRCGLPLHRSQERTFYSRDPECAECIKCRESARKDGVSGFRDESEPDKEFNLQEADTSREKAEEFLVFDAMGEYINVCETVEEVRKIIQTEIEEDPDSDESDFTICRVQKSITVNAKNVNHCKLDVDLEKVL